MAGRVTRILATRSRESVLCGGLTYSYSDQQDTSFEDMEFEFLDDGEVS